MGKELEWDDSETTQSIECHRETKVSLYWKIQCSNTTIQVKRQIQDFPGGAVDKNAPANVGDTGSIPDLKGSTYHGASKPMCHSYWARVLQWLKPIT